MLGQSLGRRLNHPLFSSWKTVLAVKAGGQCVAVAGTFHELTDAAKRGARPSHAIYTVHSKDSRLLSEPERDILWDLFEVPIYVMVVDNKGRVVAYECEAKEGLHVTDWSPENGKLEASPCDCGRPGTRWMPGSDQGSNAA